MKQQKQNPKTGVSGTIGAEAPVWLVSKWEMVSSIFFFSIICSFQFFQSERVASKDSVKNKEIDLQWLY